MFGHDTVCLWPFFFTKIYLKIQQNFEIVEVYFKTNLRI